MATSTINAEFKIKDKKAAKTIDRVLRKSSSGTNPSICKKASGKEISHIMKK